MSKNITQRNHELWDVEEAKKQITHDGLLDTAEVMNQPKYFINQLIGSTLDKIAAEARINGMFDIAIKLGQIKDPDTPDNWITWAKRKGFAIDHLQTSDIKQTIVPEFGSKKEHELHSLIEDIYKSLGCPKNNNIVWSALELDQEKRAFDKNEIIQEIEGDIIYWSSRRGTEQTMKRKTFDNFLSTLRNK